MVFRIFARDLKILLHRPVALIIVLGIAFLPSLYAWVNIWANWDPYGNTGNLQVAVASNDAGYNIEGVDINMGESIVDNLHTNDAIGWQFVDEEAAREGVRSGNYYAAVIIPEEFFRGCRHLHHRRNRTTGDRILQQRKEKRHCHQNHQYRREHPAHHH